MSLTYEQRQQLRQAVDRARREKVSFFSVERLEVELEVSLARAFDVTFRPAAKPELAPAVTFRKAHWTKQRMIAAAQEWSRQHGCSPSKNDWIRSGAYHPAGSTVCEHFGSWSSLLDLAGLPRQPVGGQLFHDRVWTRESVVLAMELWEEKHGRPPTWVDWVRAGEDYPNSRIVKKYCGSFVAARAMVREAA